MTTEKTYTPGPWTYHQHRPGCDVCTIFAGGHVPLGVTWNKADARLMAAAPELYKRLQDAQLLINQCFDLINNRLFDVNVHSICDKIDAAIAKAQGGLE